MKLSQTDLNTERNRNQRILIYYTAFIVYSVYFRRSQLQRQGQAVVLGLVKANLYLCHFYSSGGEQLVTAKPQVRSLVTLCETLLVKVLEFIWFYTLINVPLSLLLNSQRVLKCSVALTRHNIIRSAVFRLEFLL